jgi:hypothetical protein
VIVAFGGPFSRTERVALAIGLVIASVLMWPRAFAHGHGVRVAAHADHLAHGSGLVFNLGERVYAAVNPLWLGLLADAIGWDRRLVRARHRRDLDARVSRAVPPAHAAHGARAVVRAVATVAWACQAWMAQFSVSGMKPPSASP